MTRPAGRRRLTAGFALAAAGCVVSLVAAPRAARADVTADCDFLEISAKHGDKPVIDGELKPLEKKLKRPPLSSWNQFKLLSHAQKALAKKKPEPIGLKTGSATATLVEIVDKSKVRLTVTMNDARGKEVANNTATVEAGDYLIYGYPLPGNEGHVLSVSCK
ncbi:MAG TPA: hypothetical protein VHT91_32035 [Kofleriaceae bacterium]|jgi:hypothetical protein|nr:hypothetical protein [Kofleriaceae bacterium]